MLVYVEAMPAAARGLMRHFFRTSLAPTRISALSLRKCYSGTGDEEATLRGVSFIVGGLGLGAVVLFVGSGRSNNFSHCSDGNPGRPLVSQGKVHRVPAPFLPLWAGMIWLPTLKKNGQQLVFLSCMIGIVDAFAFNGTIASRVLPTVMQGWGLYGAVGVLGIQTMLNFSPALAGPDFKVRTASGEGVLSENKVGLSYIWGAAEMRGWRPNMEDKYLSDVPIGGAALFAVFDGHGGHAASEAAQALLPSVAERILCGEAPERMVLGEAPIPSPDAWEARLPDVVQELDDALLHVPAFWHTSLSRQLLNFNAHPLSGTGSTSVIAILSVREQNPEIIVANTGDSRVILGRRGRVIAMSEDHKPEDIAELTRIEAAGGRVIKVGPCHRIDGSLNLSRALGDFRYKANPALRPCEQRVICKPDIKRLRLQPDDEFVVLACDGIFESLDRWTVVDFVRQGLAAGKEPSLVAKELCWRACARDPYELGTDNETVIIVKLTWRKESQASCNK